MIQANPPQPAAQATLQRIMNLQQRFNDQIVISTELRNRSRDLEARIEVLRTQNEEGMQKVREYTEKVETLGEYLENRSIISQFIDGLKDLVLLFISIIRNSIGYLAERCSCYKSNE